MPVADAVQVGVEAAKLVASDLLARYPDKQDYLGALSGVLMELSRQSTLLAPSTALGAVHTLRIVEMGCRAACRK